MKGIFEGKVENMIKGDIVEIAYHNIGKTIIATFYENVDGYNLFQDATGFFGVSDIAVKNGEIAIDVIED